ncbi:hypothetical protein DPMN_165692 [Dreissena polymorpha]|uniref:Uncharacterized protein n=1 Tax=Dreissena polymorpha TaxID=45954 RepID=A0A9D4ITH6_DREPO|nr:hypothetical protein DPMN_165692 [Dreissena polymorpha]
MDKQTTGTNSDSDDRAGMRAYHHIFYRLCTTPDRALHPEAGSSNEDKFDCPVSAVVGGWYKRFSLRRPGTYEFGWWSPYRIGGVSFLLPQLLHAYLSVKT